MAEESQDVAAMADALATIAAKIVRPEAGLEAVREDFEVELDLVVASDGAIDFVAPGAASFEGALESTGQGTRHRIGFASLPGNDIYEAIAKLDRKRTPNQGLRQLADDGRLVPASAAKPGDTLLIVHGTFSNSEWLLGGVARGDAEFLSWARAHYAQILTFDYATMSRQALANAMALHRLLAPYANNRIDVISHSQGGLVTRYWLEAFDRRRLETTRSVFVAGTLAGTSLAAPPSLKNALGLLANVAQAIGTTAELASGAIPLFGYVAGLFGILEKTLGFVSRAPLFDAGVALIPGFQGMSRVGNNAELDELRRALRSVPPGYFAVAGDFEPNPLTWRFWNRFVSRATDGAADLLFNGPNDLVVDTVAQTELADALAIDEDDPSRVLSYRVPNDSVHHTNYFEQPKTLRFIRGCLHRE